MNKPDLVDQMQLVGNANQCENICAKITSVMNKLSDDQKLQVFRDLMLEQIYSVIDKFPQQTQKEMLAIMSNKYLTGWDK